MTDDRYLDVNDYKARRPYGQRECTLTLFKQEIRGRQIVLPLPPSENDRLEVNLNATRTYLNFYYRKAKRYRCGLMRNSTTYNRWKAMAEGLLMMGKLPQLEGKVAALVTVVFPDNRVRDAQNREKALFDAFQGCGCLIDNDTNIVLHTTTKKVIKGKSFIYAVVFPLSQLPHNPWTVSDEYLNQIASEIIL